MKRFFVTLVVLAAMVAGWLYLVQPNGYLRAHTSVCTAEAKQCPDGSYVGRTGLKCEFAPCPSPVTGVTVTVQKVIQDSRCATDVQCIQAGTVVVQATVKTSTGSYPATFTLGTPVTVGGHTITLSGVDPAPKSTVHLTFADYRFSFTIAK